MIDKNKLRGATILITGAKGFIGQHLIERLKSYETNIISPGIQECDVTNKAQVYELIKKEKPKIIYHLAASLKDNFDDLDDIFNININGTKNILDCAKKVDSVKSVVLMGSSADTNPHSSYGMSKKITSLLGTCFSKHVNYSIVTLKPFIVYGPGQKNNMFIPAMIKAYKNSEVFGMSQGQQRRDFVFVDDMIDSIITASLTENISGEIIEIGTGNPTQLLEIVKIMKELTKNKFKYDNTVYQMRVGEIMEHVANTKKAENLLKWKAKVNIEEGLRKTLDWWENEGI